MKTAKAPQPNQKTGGSSPRTRRAFFLSAGFLVILLAAGYLAFRPRPAWLVEEAYIPLWEDLLADSPSPLRNARVIPLPSAEAESLPPWYYGYRVGADVMSGGPGGEEAAPPPFRVYRGLAGAEGYDDALPLALDPWFVFRKYMDPVLPRDRVEDLTGSRGILAIPGGDAESLWAWTAQFLQQSPAAFPPDRETWNAAMDSLFAGRRFQQGAQTYTWDEIWYALFGDSLVWVYAPLSRIRALPVYETNILEAGTFPTPENWTEFGLQAEILWARPFGENRLTRKTLEQGSLWLRDVRTHTFIADTLGWLAVHPDAPPYNPVSAAARIAWLSSSYVWERAE
jgi:hypothetical protein